MQSRLIEFHFKEKQKNCFFFFKENHYGLHENSPDGCRSCSCHPGGSYSLQCDINTGQCPCREGMTGRQCDTPAPGTYCAGLKFFTYEAELARVEEKVCCFVFRQQFNELFLFS